MEDPKPPQTTPPIETPTPNQNLNQNQNPNPDSNPSPNPNPNPNPNPDSNPSPKPDSNSDPNPNPNPNPKPPRTTQTPPPQPPNLPQESKKRPLDENAIQNSNYFKMRAVLKDLRPHFIEVLRTPVFQNCIPANEIREQMKLLMDLYKEITAETISIGKCRNMLEGQVSSEIHDGQKPIEHHQPSPADRAFTKASEEKQTQGSHIVGGSAFGWNFITYQGSKAVYYGRTKEMFRSANVIPQGSPS